MTNLMLHLPDEAIVVEVETQRVDAGDEQVQAEVELSLVYQVRTSNIPKKYRFQFFFWFCTNDVRYGKNHSGSTTTILLKT